MPTYPFILNSISPLQEKDAKFDRALREISEELSAEHDIENLGRQLDIKQAVMERAIMNNSRFTEITFQGTLTMLRNWRKKIRSIADARRTLTKALEDANLANLIDKYLDEGKYYIEVNLTFTRGGCKIFGGGPPI